MSLPDREEIAEILNNHSAGIADESCCLEVADALLALIQFHIAAALAEEREACAKVADAEQRKYDELWERHAHQEEVASFSAIADRRREEARVIAAAIRARP